MVPFRTQNLSLLNKYLSTIWAAKAVPSSFIPGIYVLVPGNAHLSVTYLLETSPGTARRTRARLVLGVIPLRDTQSSGIDVLCFPLQSTYSESASHAEQKGKLNC